MGPPTATLVEQAQARELAVVVDGPHAGRWYWRDELEAMQQSARRMGYPPAHPAATFTRYRPTDEWAEHPCEPGVQGRAWRYHQPPATPRRVHRRCYETTAGQLRIAPNSDAYVFSYKPAHDAPCDPSAVTHRYSKMCRQLGIDSHLHAMRHYSATELLTAGVDLRTVAGRLGHGGGGATTLRVYAAWVSESDRRAAEILGSQINRPPRLPAP